MTDVKVDEKAFQKMMDDVWEHPFPDREAICRAIIESYESARTDDSAMVHPLSRKEAVEKVADDNAFFLACNDYAVYQSSDNRIAIAQAAVTALNLKFKGE